MKKPVLAVVMLLVLLFNGAMTPARSAAESMHAAFSSRQIFEGTFFGEGPVAKLMPEIWNDDTRRLLHIERLAGTPAFQSHVKSIESRIAQVDPGYFASLSTDMTSGDPNRVQRAIQRTHHDMAQLAVHPGWGASQVAWTPVGTVQTLVNINDTAVAFEAVLVIAAVGLAVIGVVVIVPLVQTADTNQYAKDETYAIITARMSGLATTQGT